MNPIPIDVLRTAMMGALRAHDELLAAWRQVESTARSALDTPEDVKTLKELIVRRIDIMNSFDALVRVDRAAAMEVLLSRYLGSGVDPDKKFGGYTSELAVMLDDLREAGGVAALRTLVSHVRFARELLSDRRVIEALADALEIPCDQVRDWAERA